MVRRSLTHVGGEARLSGDPDLARALAAALDVKAAGADAAEPERAHVHGFHTYPARMHPETAARLVELTTPPGGRVLDPFCGSGTVLVEALALGRRARGSDLNPLAVMLARSKTRPREERELEALVRHAARISEAGQARRKAKAGATVRYPPEDAALFEPHVLLELDSLRAGVFGPELDREPELREDLALVLSSILVKVSKKRADTSRVTEARRTRAGFTLDLFAKKAAEYAERLRAFQALRGRGPGGAPLGCKVVVSDARALSLPPDGRADAIVTSPPYAGTYDYLSHHDLRLRWLELDARGLERVELGARRDYARLEPRAARERHATETRELVEACARLTRPGGKIALVVADSGLRGTSLQADVVLRAVLPRGVRFVAQASQDRPHFHKPTERAFADRPRAEHAILLEIEKGRYQGDEEDRRREARVSEGGARPDRGRGPGEHPRRRRV